MTTTISLLRLPFLVQRQIFDEINLLEAFFISMLSKRSEETVKACIRHHQYTLEYTENEFLAFNRRFPKRNNVKLSLGLINQSELEHPYQWLNMGNQEMVPIKIFTLYYEEIITVVHIYCQSKPDFALNILQRLLKFLPKVSLTLKFKTQNVDSFRKTMESVEGVNEIKEIDFGYFFWHPDQAPHDKLVKLILEKSQRAKNLRVTVSTSENFEYPTNGVPFKFDSVSMACTDWISRNHFIKLFLSCKKVELHWKDFDDEDLGAIFRAWTEGSALEFLRFIGTDHFYQRKTLSSILKEFPGATPVKNALIQTEVLTRSHVETFGEGKCCLIQQNDAQTTALVCILSQSVILTTEFKIGKEVDEMVAPIEEERLFRQQHLLDENMEAEDDD